MIHYHGTPVSGGELEAVDFLKGRHAFVSFAYPRDIYAAAEVAQTFALDNGAFSAWTKGKALDIDGYLAWVETWHRHPAFDWAIIPDVIDGDEAANDALLAAWPRKFAGVPVWHLHESLERLQRLCAEWPRVALGSSGSYSTPNTDRWWVKIAYAMDAICDAEGRPVAKLHGLRMLNPEVFTRLPLASADSTNAAVNAGSLKRHGSYPAPSAGLRAAVIADRIEAFQSAPFWERPAQIPMAFNQSTGLNRIEDAWIVPSAAQ